MDSSANNEHVNDQDASLSAEPSAPAGCPGVSSSTAGKSTPCQGCPNQRACSSGQAAKDVETSNAEMKEKLADVKFKILVMSGKGGVGKSTITTALSRYLASDGESQVGVVDLDICGPSLATMFHAEDQSVHESNDSWCPVVVDENLYLMSVWFLLSSPDDAVVWRGPRKNGLIKQFLSKVKWDYLDYMVVDTPPGTSDEHLSVTQLLHQTVGVDAVVLVTTPQEVSLLDVKKQITFCRKMKLPIIGVVENMAYFRQVVSHSCSYPTQQLLKIKQ